MTFTTIVLQSLVGVLQSLVEVLGRYSNLYDQAQRLKELLEIVPEGKKPVNTRARKQIQHRLRKPESAQLIIGYLEGRTTYQLAKEFSIHRNTVSTILERAGVARRLSPLTEAQIDRALKLYAEGLSLVSIANELGCSHTTVGKALVTAGVELRPRRGWGSRKIQKMPAPDPRESAERLAPETP